MFNQDWLAALTIAFALLVVCVAIMFMWVLAENRKLRKTIRGISIIRRK